MTKLTKQHSLPITILGTGLIAVTLTITSYLLLRLSHHHLFEPLIRQEYKYFPDQVGTLIGLYLGEPIYNGPLAWSIYIAHYIIVAAIIGLVAYALIRILRRSITVNPKTLSLTIASLIFLFELWGLWINSSQYGQLYTNQLHHSIIFLIALPIMVYLGSTIAQKQS